MDFKSVSRPIHIFGTFHAPKLDINHVPGPPCSCWGSFSLAPGTPTDLPQPPPEGPYDHDDDHDDHVDHDHRDHHDQGPMRLCWILAEPPRLAREMCALSILFFC